MTKEVYDSGYTQCALTERIKQELAKVPLDKEEYLSQIREHKRTRSLNQYYYDFDYELELDLSIDPDNPEDIKGKLYDDKWYYYKAHHYLKIGVFLNPPPFKVSLTHLSPEVIVELDAFDSATRQYILKQSVAKIFEDNNFELYHNSVSSRLEVVMVE